jgi:phospholipid/cholesterol/gamma-HCH transport system substrate-binding protein
MARMETRSNKYLVFGVVAALLVSLFGYVIWALPEGSTGARSYDLVFERSVSGLAEQSPVSFSGVAVGRVERIRFSRNDPETVRVRILITDHEAPILEGTTASLHRDLFGTALINLNGAPRGSPVLLPGPDQKVAVIPVERGGVLLGEDPMDLLESVSATTDKLNQALSPAGQRSISQTISDLERRSAELADRAPALADTIAHTRAGMRSGAEMAKVMGANAEAMDRKLQATGGGTRELRASAQSTRASLEQFDAQVEAARPRLEMLEKARIDDQLSELQGTVSEFKETVQKVDSAGAGSLLSEPQLPDYEPRK